MTSCSLNSHLHHAASALQHINLIGLSLYDTHFYVRDYSLLALSCSPGDVCVLWLRMKFIASRLCHGYDSLKLSKFYNRQFAVSLRQKERNNQWKPNCFRFPLIRQQFQTISSLPQTVCEDVEISARHKATEKIIYLFLFTLRPRNCLMNVVCWAWWLLFPLRSRVAGDVDKQIC